MIFVIVSFTALMAAGSWTVWAGHPEMATLAEFSVSGEFRLILSLEASLERLFPAMDWLRPSNGQEEGLYASPTGTPTGLDI